MGRTDESGAGSATAGIAALAVVQVCFGLFPVAGRLAMDPETGFAPFAVATWRIAIGAAVLLLVAWRTHPKEVIPRRADLPKLFGLALLGIVLNQGLFLVGLERSTPMNAGLVICLIPVFSYAVAVLLGKEAFRGLRALGVGVAVAGAIPLFVARGGDLSSEHAFGNALMALNALCYSFYLVWSKPILKRMPALVLVAWVYALSVPWLPLFAAGVELSPETASPMSWWSLAYIIVFPTVLAYALNSFALARVDASTTAFFVFTQPIITATASWFVLGERPTGALIIAGVGLLVGMALVMVRPPNRPPLQAPSPSR